MDMATALRKKKPTKPRNIAVVIAITHCKPGSHKDKRNKRQQQDQQWEKDLRSE